MAGVLEGVGEGLLHDAVHGELDPAIEGGGLTAGAVHDLGTGRADAGAQGVEVGDARLRAEFGGVRRGGLHTQHAQHAPEFTERLASRVADEEQRLLATLGGEVGGVGAAVGEGDDDGEVVADDVVHLPCHTRAFGGGGESAALVALDLQAGGTVAQYGELGAPDADDEAERDRRRDRAEQDEQRVQHRHLGRQPQREQPQRGEGDRAGDGQPLQLPVQHETVEGDQQGDVGAQPDPQPGLDEEHRGDQREGQGRPAAPPQQRQHQPGL